MLFPSDETPIVSFFVPGVPACKGSMVPMRNRKTGRMFVKHDDPKLGDWSKRVKGYAALEKIGKPVECAVMIVATFGIERPQSVSAEERPLPSVRPDLDKMTRAVLDAMTGVVWRDDGQVTAAIVRKRYAKPEGVEISVYEDFGLDATQMPATRVP